MITPENNVICSQCQDRNAKALVQGSAALANNVILFPALGHPADEDQVVAENRILNVVKKHSVKFILAAITFAAIVLFEKSLKDAWLIPSMATMVFVVPFIEEFGKFLSLKYRFSVFFLILFLGVESYLYISHLSFLIGLEKILFLRVMVCIMHLSTFYFQWMARVYSENHNKQHHVTAAYFLSVGIHALWNYGF